ncbi:PP2C family protein-serine/threonine phosphatase [Actinomadura sp. WAC 06369]|uniref:PP2C family protein-serine/threonine phosphatase n=1 Tax=Actinomadura sp. WAC 06369 TaxID=2203193 RepID=UPI000F7746F3|nr:SpoIIE family protein phosphatase [Actinomadura sp. WAC 06369]RSN68199.1 histidine kinase [Actinomadura sp. WAC 06369]
MAGPDDELELLRDLYERAPCGYVLMHANGLITLVNATFCDWTGRARDELTAGVRFQELLPIGDRLYYETHFAPLLAMQRTVHEIAVDVTCAGGARLPVLLNGMLVEEPGGAAESVRVCVFRATDRREYERELLRTRQRARESEARARQLARTLQDSLLPDELPVIPSLDAGGAYRPAGHGDEVGGDFYDLFEIAPGRWGLVLGDVSGKGAEAAVVTGLARHTVRAVAAESPRAADVLHRLNGAVLRDRSERFCTAVYAVIEERPDGSPPRVTIAVGGHPPPLRVARDGAVTALGTVGNLLGLLDEVRVADVSVELDPGDALLFYTDGVTEARGDGIDFFEEERLAELLARSRTLGAQGIADRIAEAVVEFQDGVPRDDIAVVALKTR